MRKYAKQIKGRILETERLYLRELTIEDAGNFYLLNLDYDVIKYTGDVAFKDELEAKKFLENYDQYRKYNFGRWAVINKLDDEFLGWCGLKYSQDLDEFDIGYRFFKKYWNKGYATESAKACIEIGFSEYKIPEIIGRAMKDNVGSIKVLEKIGLSYDKTFDFDGQEWVIYKIINNVSVYSS